MLEKILTGLAVAALSFSGGCDQRAKEMENKAHEAQVNTLCQNVLSTPKADYPLSESKNNFMSLCEDIDLLSEDDSLDPALTEVYEQGKLDNMVFTDFHDWLISKVKIDNREKVKGYLSLIERLPKDDLKMKELIIKADYLKGLFQEYGGGDIAFLKGLGDLVAGREIGEELNLPDSLTQDGLPGFLEIMYRLEQAKGGFNPEEENRLKVGMELWGKAPSLMERIKDWDIEKESVKEYFIFAGKMESPEQIEEGGKILEALQETLELDISKETKEMLKRSYEKNGNLLSIAVNQLNKKPSLRKSLVKALPDEIKIEILSQSLEGLGNKGGLYRSSEGLIFGDLIKNIGAGKFIDFLEGKGYNLEHEKTGRVLKMLAACGQLKKVIPREEGKRKKVYDIVLENLAEESFSRAGNVISSILGNYRLRKGFAGTLLEGYETADGEKKDFLQYMIRLNKKHLDSRDSSVKDALENPSREVLGVEGKLKIPLDEMIRNSEKREGIPVLKTAVPFADMEEDPAMMDSFKRFKKVGGKFRLVEEKENGYVLERKGSVVKKEGRVPVIFRIEAYDNPEVMSEIRNDPSYFMVAPKLHSFSLWRVLESDYENIIPRIVVAATCVSSNYVSGKKLSRTYPNTGFFATDGITNAGLNNDVIFGVINGLEKGCRDYGELTDYVKGKIGKGEAASAYAGPETFFVDGLGGK